MSQHQSDRNLLFAVLAVQMDFVSAPNLVQGLNLWMVAKTRPLGEILVEQGFLSRDQGERIEELVRMRCDESSDATPQMDEDEDETVPHQGPKPMRYRVIRKHNEGGLGEIFLARDLELEREVALKKIKEEYADDTRSQQRFRVEAEITGRLEHPSIVPVHGLGEDWQGKPYYAMRLIRGRTLKEGITEFFAADWKLNRDSSERAVHFRALMRHFLDVCNAVAYAHSRGVIHRDLKPSNVMLGPYGETLVLDWGLAKLMDEVETPDPERSQIHVEAAEQLGLTGGGSPAYMAPEQHAGRAEDVDFRTDIYLLGATLFEILTGSPPHRRDGRRPDPPRPRELVASVPAALDEITAKCMEPEQSARFQSVEELVRNLEAWLADEPILAYRQMVEEYRRLVNAEPTNYTVREQFAGNLLSLAIVLEGMNRPTETFALFEEAIASYEVLVEARPNEARHRADLANAQVHYSRVLRGCDREESAESMWESAKRGYEWLILTNPEDYSTGAANVMLSMTGAKEVIAGPKAGDGVEARTDQGSASGESSGTRTELGSEVSDEDEMSAATVYPTSEGGEADGTTAPMESRSRLTVIRELGRGASGTVLLARDNDLNRDVALKQLEYEDFDQRRFLREAEIAASLEHPNIIPVYGIGRRSDGLPFIIMKYQQGEALSVLIRNHHSESRPHWLTLEFLLRSFACVCDAVAYAHCRGVIHRDPKPANVVVSRSGEVRLADWGFAKRLAESDPGEGGVRAVPEQELDPLSTAEGAVMGTPAYMAPEMARGEISEIDERSDIYILGASLFHIVTGETRYSGLPSVSDLLMKLISGDEVLARGVRPSVSRELEAICATAMEYEREDRYQSADSMARDVRAHLEGRSISVGLRS